jgi:hypothetical protein
LTENVVHPVFGAKSAAPKPDMIWVCNCSCATMYCHEDGRIQCADCGVFTDQYRGDWRTPFVPAPSEPKSQEGSHKVVYMNDPGRVLPKMISDIVPDETAAIIIIREAGGMSVWNERLDTEERKTWMAEHLSQAFDLMVDKAPEGDAP